MTAGQEPQPPAEPPQPQATTGEGSGSLQVASTKPVELAQETATATGAVAAGETRRSISWRVAVFVAACGGVLGVLGAMVQEWRSFDIFGPFVSGPIIEEATKPVGVYILLLTRPLTVGGRWTRALLSAGAGTAFGLVESAVYVLVYVDDPSAAYITFRFTVPVLLHTLTGFIFGLGITNRLMRSVRGEVPFLSGSWPFFITSVAVHSAYNIGASVLQLTGTLTFD